MIVDFTPGRALVGGVLIGASASLFLLTHGKVAGISGLYASLLRAPREERTTPLAFIVGLVSAGLLVRVVSPGALGGGWVGSTPLLLAAGLLVGFGTQLGNGCTSGHGVCGLSRLSSRSFVATLTFMAFGFGTVYVLRHLFGATP